MLNFVPVNNSYLKMFHYFLLFLHLVMQKRKPKLQPETDNQDTLFLDIDNKLLLAVSCIILTYIHIIFMCLQTPPARKRQPTGVFSSVPVTAHSLSKINPQASLPIVSVQADGTSSVSLSLVSARIIFFWVVPSIIVWSCNYSHIYCNHCTSQSEAQKPALR